MVVRKRFLAGLALVLYVLVAVGSVWLLLRNVLFVGALVITLFGLAYGVWLMVTGSGRRARLGLLAIAASSLLLAGEVLYFIRQAGALRTLILFLLVAGAYLGLLAVLRAWYWSETRRLGEAGGNTAHFKRPYLIINPKSGNGRAVKAHIPELAREMGVTVAMTSAGQDIEVLARQVVSEGADVLGVSGGDGTIGAVAKVAMEHHLPMVVLPGGTRCHFARDIGLEPERIADALAGFHGIERRVDAASINGRIFLNNTSFGLYADIVDNPDYRDHKRHVSRRVLQDILSGAKPTYGLEFRHGDTSYQSAVQVLVGVNRYNTVDVFELGQRNRLDEGVLQVTAITRLDDAMVLRLIRAVSFRQLREERQVAGFHQWTASAFEVSGTDRRGRLVVGVDGEREEYDTPVRVRILPAALRLYVPAEGARGRRKNPFGLFIGRQLWQAAFRPGAKRGDA